MKAIGDQAALWVARVDGGLTADETRELETWLAADRRHRGAYARALAYWVYLDRFAALNGVPARVGSFGALSMSRRQLVAAGVAVAAVAGGASWWLRPRTGGGPQLSEQRYSSEVGEIRRVVLSDGSVVLLNTASAVLVRFDQHQRNVQLLYGEVLFEVAHDKAHPFFVNVLKSAVRAVGTAFAVRVKSDRVDVTVTEGVVEIGSSELVSASAAASSHRSSPARVSAFQQAVITRTSTVEIRAITTGDAIRQLAWREGMVSFNGQSLEAAVSEINRYNHRQIIVDDLALAAKRVVGVFGVTDLDGFASAAAAALKGKAIADGEVIRLQSDPTAGQK